ncbi:alpha/beta fold hydrolase [Paralcaligenes ureilyticus]|uniref:Pimeloyl-ACP methyl ester carboxylesterase n=1 Tax=Paralcaligenes ureilyticus TaxID=627131 RepID=A0A4R3LV38_9BURK|nr:alpha/beta hydrolase [Paralcaligenes ureilyticus]TCT04411.1 pimeloyl-ACP methyl ester carboxylesterase [Paralcaligenes ureilyticus]
MTEPRLDYVSCASPSGVHRMAYWEWGDPDNDRVLVCAHGLTRTGRDFDTLAARLSTHYRVVCPDVVGRGQSDWLANPAGYVVPQYVADMLTLIARLQVSQVNWLGTSMGGLIGLALAGALAMSAAMRPDRGGDGLDPKLSLRLGKVILNDIGPRLDYDGLARIGDYVGEARQFDTFDQAVDYVHSVSEGFGPHTRAQWGELTRQVFIRRGDHWIKRYDLAMAQPFALQTPEVVRASEALLWGAYESIHTPMLLIRGALSDLFAVDVAQEMLARNSHARLVEIPGVGHAPTFFSDDQIDLVETFLLTS